MQAPLYKHEVAGNDSDNTLSYGMRNGANVYIHVYMQIYSVVKKNAIT